MGFYLKLILLLSLVGQSIATACVDIIVEQHDARRKLFNTSSYEGTVADAAFAINGHSGQINGILINEKKVNPKRSATTDEKEKILTAVMAERFVAKKIETKRDGKIAARTVNPYKNTYADAALAGHFKVLELTWEFADQVSAYLANSNFAPAQKSFAYFSTLLRDPKYNDLLRFLSIDAQMYMSWLHKTVAEHFIGLISPESMTHFQVTDFMPVLNFEQQFHSHLERLLVKSIAEVRSNPFSALSIACLRKKHDDQLQTEFCESAFKETISYHRISIEREYVSLSNNETEQAAFDVIRKVAADTNNPRQREAGAFLLDLVRSIDTEPGKTILAAILENNSHSYQMKAMAALMESEEFSVQRTIFQIVDNLMQSNNLNHKAIARVALFSIAESCRHPFQWDAAGLLWSSENPDDKTIARAAFKAITQDNTHQYQSEAVYLLWRSKNSDDKAVAKEALITIAQNTRHSYQYNATCLLWGYDNPSDKTIARTAFKTITQDNTHRYQWDAISLLWKSEDSDGKAIARDALSSIAKSNGHCYQFSAAQLLWKSEDSDEKAIAREALKRIVQRYSNPHLWDAINLLWKSEDSDGKVIARDALSSIAKSNDHREQYNAAQLLWKSENSDHKALARIAFKMIIANNTNPAQWPAVCLLWESENSDDKAIARGALKIIAKSDGHSEQYRAVQLLWRSENPDDKPVARSALSSIAGNKSHLEQYNAAQSLWQSENPEDKRIATAAFNAIAQSTTHAYSKMARGMLLVLSANKKP